ncbi:hypothetical protein E2P81_ATG02785 [Venturia nashicola]|uniref:Rhodopsin domain-containing protein n=1 Tax=Venturia nashicola TaxID=86259 RepID=A0A4Z1PBK1_9PEZI|nr:hypothetical protein E6O75_ATG02844 [Venturia nashicola]TLD37003.1 hypothetical protein E2P81_ATG02785 [Venturia nashicola]
MVSIFTDNANNPEGHNVVILAVCFLAFTWPVLGLRFWVRHAMLHLLGADDVFALIAQTAFTGYCISLMVTIHFTPGANPSSLPIAEKTVAAFISSETTYAASMLFLKLSLGAFFLRVLVTPLQRCVVFAMMVASVITNLMGGIWVIFLCGVPDGHYHLHIVARECGSVATQSGIAYSQAAVNTLTDIGLAAMPVWLLWRMEMKTSTKISVGAILILATGGTIASMIRFKYISLILDPKIGFYRTVAPLMVMCIIELGAGLLACSLATLRPLLVLWLKMTASSRHFSKSHYTSSRSVEDGTAEPRPSVRLSEYVLPEMPKSTCDDERRRNTGHVVFQMRGVSFLDKTGGRSEDNFTSLV